MACWLIHAFSRTGLGPSRPPAARGLAHLLVALLLAAAQPASSQTPVEGVATDLRPLGGGAEWTVLVYMASDNNLDAANIHSLQLMEAIGSSDRLKIVAFIDRASDPKNMEWKTARRALILHRPEPGLQSFNPALPTCQELGEVNSADPGQLRDFVSWAAHQYPARRFALVMMSHGGGWRGLDAELSNTAARGMLQDDASGGEPAKMKAIRQALEQAGTHFELIILESCLMGSVEVAWELKSLTAWLLASEQLMYTRGVDYSLLLTALAHPGGIDPVALGHGLTARYMENLEGAPDLTLALIRTSALGPLLTQLNRLVGRLEAGGPPPLGPTAAPPVSLERVRQESGPPMCDRETNQHFLYFDLGSFLERLGSSGEFSAPVRDQARQALHAYRAAIPVFASSRRSGRSGLSIYFPSSIPLDPLQQNEFYFYTPEHILFARDCRWPRFIIDYAQRRTAALPENQAPDPEANAEMPIAAGHWLKPADRIRILPEPQSKDELELPGATPGRDVWLRARTATLARQDDKSPMQVLAWEFFDARGNWLPAAERARLDPRQSGLTAELLRYQPPESRAVLAFLMLLDADPATGKLLDACFAGRVIYTANEAGARDIPAPHSLLTPDNAWLRQRARALACLPGVFTRRSGRDGLQIRLQCVSARNGRIRFRLEADRPCRALLLNVSSNGVVSFLGGQPQVLSPEPGRPLTIPSADGFRLGGASGEERVAAVAAVSDKLPASGDAAETARRWLEAGAASDAVTLTVTGEEPRLIRRREAAR